MLKSSLFHRFPLALLISQKMQNEILTCENLYVVKNVCGASGKTTNFTLF